MIKHITTLLIFGLIINGCINQTLPSEEHMNSNTQIPEIFPDYADITIPANIAPLNFMMNEEGSDFKVAFEGDQGKVLQLDAKNRVFQIPAKKWKRLLDDNQGSQLKVTIYRKVDDQWESFAPFSIHVAIESIDPYLAYRLIPPGYETWSEMGLYQRDLTSFREEPIIENQYIQDNCVNCHSFSNWDSENMLFHVRGSVGGTMIKKGNEIEKINLKTEEALSAGVYPAWHPSGDYIAFSTNKIEQHFHAHPEKTIEVHDRHSDLIIYNTESRKVTHVPGTKGDRYMETYPSWSPDGTFLYFSCTDADATTPFDSIRYDIFRIAFNPANGQFGVAEPVFVASSREQSASFPRISPDGNYLLCTIHNYGTFPIWHPEADLCLIDLGTGDWEIPVKVNSDDTDSYHSWAKNNRWIIFSSRRYDGQYTKLYISYFNKEGQFQKAFLLPQQNPEFYKSFFFSYNRPELITSSVEVNPRKWIKAVRSDALSQ